MVTVELFDELYIEIDDYNYTLKERGVGHDKDGNEKPTVKTIGYYSDIYDAVKRALSYDTEAKNKGAVISISEYLKGLETAYKRLKDMCPIIINKG